MPIYEYKCANCGENFELMRSLNAEDSDLKCPKCGASNPQRTISLFASGTNMSDNCAPSPSGGG